MEKVNEKPLTARSTTGRIVRRRGQMGMMLATMLAMVVVLAIIMASTALLTTNLLHSTARRMDQTEAVNMADAGIDLAVGWLESQSYPPLDTAIHPLSNFWGAPNDSQGRAVLTAPFGQAGTTLTIAIYSDNANISATQKHYVIEAKAVMPNGANNTVRAYVQQVSFSKYAFFADIDSGGFWDWHNHFEGPFHSNCSDGKPSTFLWTPTPPTGTAPIFEYQGPGALETTIAPVWWKNTTRSVGAPSSSSDWNTVAAGGLASISINTNNTITMPTTSYYQEYVALGQTPPLSPTTPPSTGVPTRTGVTVTASGGIYVHGDNTMVLSLDTNGNQVFTVTTAPVISSTTYSLTQTVTVTSTGTTINSTLKKGTTVIAPTVSPANQFPNAGVSGVPSGTVSGALNGVVFSDGNITTLYGTVADNTVDTSGNITYRNQWSIVTDTSAGKDMYITQSLVTNTQRDFTITQAQDTNYNTKAGTLGLVSNDVDLSTTAPALVAVNAVIFATGSYQAQTTIPNKGTTATMTEVGGVIVKQSGIFANADSSGNITSGWNEVYHYDSRMADNPPPYFPTTGSHYIVASYQSVNSMLQ